MSGNLKSSDSTPANRDLVAYKSPTAIPNTPFDESLPNPIDAPIPTPLPLNLPYAHKESIDVILDEQIISTRDGGVQHFLIRWWRQPNFDCTWITRDEPTLIGS